MPDATEEQDRREAREAAERKRAAWIVLGTMVAGILALIIASVLLMRP